MTPSPHPATFAPRRSQSARPGRPFHIGPDRDRPVFTAAGALTPHDVAPVALAQADFAVCTGLVDDTKETPADYEAILVACRAKNLPMICANPDLVVYRGDQLVYCAGALAERYEELGGEVEQAGKPYAPIYRMAIGLLEKAWGKPLAIDRILAIGDAVHTDIAGAVEHGHGQPADHPGNSSGRTARSRTPRLLTWALTNSLCRAMALFRSIEWAGWAGSIA